LEGEWKSTEEEFEDRDRHCCYVVESVCGLWELFLEQVELKTHVEYRIPEAVICASKVYGVISRAAMGSSSLSPRLQAGLAYHSRSACLGLSRRQHGDVLQLSLLGEMAQP